MDLVMVFYVLVALIIPLWLISKANPFTRTVNKVPGPMSLPFIGTAYLMFNLQRNQFFAKIDEITKKYWPIFRTWNGSFAEVHVMEAEHVEVLLSSTVNINKGFTYKFLHSWLGTGLLTSTGAKWHSHRKLITPTFHFKILDSFLEVFDENSRTLVYRLEQEAGNTKGFDVYSYITLCALDIICETAMGTRIDAQNHSHSSYVSAIYEASELILARLVRPWLYTDFIYKFTKDGKKYQKDVSIMHGFTNKVIKGRKEVFFSKANGKVSEEDDFGKKRRLAFLDLLLEASKGGTVLSDEEIREEVDTFMFEGHDTTSASLCWTLFLMGGHPDVQERVHQELEGIFQGSDRAPTMRDLGEMKYLERVIKESLRLYPSVPFIARSVTEEVKVGEYTIPAGCHVALQIYHVHRNPKYFPNPDTFDPDNFLPERVQGRHPYAYVPFSAGSRNCIGQKFALMEEKVILSSIIRNFRLKSLEKPEDITLMGELILRPEKGIKLALERR